MTEKRQQLKVKQTVSHSLFFRCFFMHMSDKSSQEFQ